MVAYNFAAQFAGAVADGRKQMTIRRNGNRRHARAGERLQLYTGQRTTACRKLVDPDPICMVSHPIQIWIADHCILDIRIDIFPVQDIDRFATDDGFADAAAMHRFFLRMHGPGLFVGRIILWEPAD